MKFVERVLGVPNTAPRAFTVVRDGTNVAVFGAPQHADLEAIQDDDELIGFRIVNRKRRDRRDEHG